MLETLIAKKQTKKLGFTGPTEMYLQPNTTSQELGWHYKEHFTMSQKPSWTYIERWPIVQNEMTKFVDHMKRNDRDFIFF
ncbi:Hypothetical predicted protein [Octopus vulgaris]|uniref:Uncharacterized protein n=1 Tax=Octopus vulgaris TaxID=6645 RepID=A0AA36AMY1_OCTVU|nr:Hypothetical predicted protein [Octopus vulgaris]